MARKDGPGLFRRMTDRLFPSRQAPARTTTQARQVRERVYGGSTKAMAQAFGVKERTVQRWLKGDRSPRGEDAKKLEQQAARAQVTDRGRERRAKQLEAQGDSPTPYRLTVQRAGTTRVRGSDMVRGRPMNLYLTGEQAARLARAESEEDVTGVAREAIADYFNGGPSHGYRADDFDVDPGGVDLS